MATRTTWAPPWTAIVERAARNGWTSLAPLALVTAVLGLLTAVPWPPATLALAGIATAAISLVAPRVGVGLLATSIPAQRVAEQHLGAIELRRTSVILLRLVEAWALRLVATQRPQLRWTAVPFAGYVLIAAASGVVAYGARVWAEELFRWSAALVVPVIATYQLPSRRRATTAAQPVMIGMAAGAAASLLGCYQTLTGARDGWRTLRSAEQSTARAFATQERLAHSRSAGRMAPMHPPLGVGAGNFSIRFREFTTGERFRASRGHAHSPYLQAAARSGLLGLAAYPALLATAGVRLARAVRRAREPETRALVVGAIGVTLALVVHGAFKYPHALSLGPHLGIAWALAEVAARTEGPVGGGAVTA